MTKGINHQTKCSFIYIIINSIRILTLVFVNPAAFFRAYVIKIHCSKIILVVDKIKISNCYEIHGIIKQYVQMFKRVMHK